MVVVPTSGLHFSVTASRIFPTLNVAAHLKTLFLSVNFIAHPAVTLRSIFFVEFVEYPLLGCARCF